MIRLGLAAMAAFASLAAAAAHAQNMAVTTQDMVWAAPGGLELSATIYRPAGRSAESPMPTVIDVHGGAWSFSDRSSGQVYDEGLAGEGFLVIAIDFRQGADHPHPAASADVAAAVRWVRLNADALGANPARIGLIGSSSGGHLAMLAALRPDADAHKGTPITDLAAPDAAPAAHDDIDARVDYVVAMWPVSDPLARFRYAQRAGIDGLLGGHNAYFGGDEAAMLDASIPRIVTSGEAGAGEALPPILAVQPGMDSNIPQDITLDLIRAYQSRDGRIEYAFYPGQSHAFGHRPSADTDDLISLAASFMRRHGTAD